MAKQEHIELLIWQGISAWNRWREKNRDVKPDLSGADLTGANLFGGDLRGAKLGKADLRGAELFGANLSGADLRGANFGQAYLSEADLSRTDLSQANLSQARLLRADLSGAVGLTQEEVDSAQGDEGTKLPEGIRRPAHWTTKSKNTQNRHSYGRPRTS